MLTYTYTAKRSDSEELIQAEVQAENENAAAKLLMGQGLFPITIQTKTEGGFLKGSFGSHIGGKDRIIFTRQLSTLITAGLPLTQSLRTVRDQLSNKALQQVVDQIVASVEAGTSLSAAFNEHPKVFNDIYVSLIAAGEATGSLDKSLERIATQQEKDAAIVSKIRGALIYPIIVLVVILLVMVYMLVTVLPLIANLYHDLHKQLPITTRILSGTANFIIHFWWIVLIGIGALGFAGFNYFHSENGRRLMDTVKLQAPIFGRMFRKVYMARFARTLSTMLGSGIPMLEGLAIVQRSVSNYHVEMGIERAMQGVKGGKALSSMLEKEEYFLKLVPQMIKIGEQSGSIDQMLTRVAVYYEDEVDEEVRNLSTTLEPILMVVLGVSVGGLLAAILLPVYSLVGSGLNGA